MATITSTWTENVDVYTGQTIGTASSRTDDIDIAAGEYFDIFCHFKCTFHGSATAGASIEVFGSTDSGTTDSTDPVIAFDIPVDAGATVVVPFKIPTGVPYVAVKASNLDGSQTLTACELTYAGLQVTSA